MRQFKLIDSPPLSIENNTRYSGGYWNPYCSIVVYLLQDADKWSNLSGWVMIPFTIPIISAVARCLKGQ